MFRFSFRGRSGLLPFPALRARSPAGRAAVICAAAACAAVVGIMPASAVPMPPKPLLGASALTEAAHSSGQIWESVAALPSGDILILSPVWPGNTGPQLQLLGRDGALSPFPDAAWNAAGGDPSGRFVSVTAMTVLPDGALWILDSGRPSRDGTARVALPRLIRFDPASGSVVQTVTIRDTALRPESFLSAIQIHGTRAYVLDSGSAAIVLVHLDTGVAERRLEMHPSLTSQKPIAGPEGIVKAANGRPFEVDASLLAISPDGRWLYYQPYSGPLYRLSAETLEDSGFTGAAVEESATLWYKTPALGGMTVGPDGTLYWSDVTSGSIESYTPGRVPHRLITDPRLHWPGGLAVDGHGTLYVPAAQLDRSAWFTHGDPQVQPPVVLWKFAIPAMATSDVVEK
ncbi:major royal jelly family protein [Acetobacter sp. AN02]|uniref:L-dopachrome tautomerase-related protein n=1 Tax=Acetobacter sp. AN02 TaxID=2894186 RepID=UPI0024345EB9|nr:L-dopachrome tautomerase-related protein [Acetobacter sp. AN02]MDG6093586.1 major royal jelly family protein [Acetobacter sp. AN02]